MQPLLRLRSLPLLLLGAMAAFGVSLPASAHPMGNFSISHYSALTAQAGRLAVRHVLDFAEIPAFDEKRKADVNGDQSLSPTELSDYAKRRGVDLLPGLALQVDSDPKALRLISTTATLHPGAGGLSTLRLELRGEADLPERPCQVRFEDRNFAERAGWRELVVNATHGVTLAGSTAATADRSQALTAYPTDPTLNPPQEIRAEFQVAPTGISVARSGGLDTALPVTVARIQQTRDDAFTRLIHTRELSPQFLLLALLTAFVLGAGHALSPGHGKTMVAAYLVGSRGTMAHAALLGVTVTISHTLGVFLLGLVALYLSNYILPEQLFPWLGFLSGATVAVIGLNLFVRRLRGLQDGFDGHSHGEESDHGHSHSHSHSAPSHAHSHSHASTHHHIHSSTGSVSHASTSATTAQRVPPRDAPLESATAQADRVSLGSLLGLGISGGIVPCPSALVVLLSAIALHRIALGLLLILAFSAGLASVLVLIGVLVVQGQRLAARSRWSAEHAPAGLRRAFQRLPVLSAAAVCLLGLAIAVQSLPRRPSPPAGAVLSRRP